MKHCPRCGDTKQMIDFGFRDKAGTKFQSYCKACTNRYARAWYARAENLSRQLEAVAIRRQRIRVRNRVLIREHKNRPCADYGVSFPPEVMDFDHLASKTIGISRMVSTHGTEALMREIERCEVVCANCHRIRTASRARAVLVSVDRSRGR